MKRLIIFLALASCQKSDDKEPLQGMWRLDRFESLDTATMTWEVDSTRIGYTGYILYDGLGHMAIHLQPAGYGDYEPAVVLDSLDRDSLIREARFFRSNYVYFANARADADSQYVSHFKLSATDPREWGTESVRFFEFRGDTLLLTTREEVRGKKLRVRWLPEVQEVPGE